MGIVDVFASEDRVNVKFSDFYSLMRESSKAELMMNAIKCDVPHRHIREMMTGKPETPATPILDSGNGSEPGTERSAEE